MMVSKKNLINDLIFKKVLISTDKNRLQLFNAIDMGMYGGKAWPLTLQMIGEKKDKQYLFDLGYVMGEDASKELKAFLKAKDSFLAKDFKVM